LLRVVLRVVAISLVNSRACGENRVKTLNSILSSKYKPCRWVEAP